MPLYKYEAFDRKGKKVSGTLEAVSVQSARERVRAKELMPISVISIESQVGSFSIASIFEKSVDSKSKILFTKQLAVLLKSGIPLLQAVELLINQFEGKFRRNLINIKDGLKEGKSLTECLSLYPKVFSKVYVQLVKAGEATGKLENILERLVEYLEKAEETRKKIKSAMSYPLFMIAFSFIVIAVMVVYVIPNVTQAVVQPGKSLPWPTEFLMTVSNFFISNFYILFGSIITFIIGFLYWKSTARGRYLFDKTNLRIPIISYFSKTKAVVQFCKTLGLLLDSGVNLAEALDIVTNIIDNTVLTRSLKSARDKIIKEGKITHYLEETGIFPAIASYMIGTGEKSGELASMLLNVGKDYDIQLGEKTDGLVAKINPVLMGVVGGIIFFIMIAMFLPMFDIMDAMEGFGT